jgi:hypothetical protein
MPKVIITAQVENTMKWEEGFRTHAELFKAQTINKPIGIGIGEDSHVALYIEMEDLATYLDLMNSDQTAEAMAFDGVKPETVKMFVLDREFAF